MKSTTTTTMTLRDLLMPLLLAGMIIPLMPERTFPQERTLCEDFRGRWLFAIGDDHAWSDPAFNDSKWDEIFVPSPWEDEGYPGYDGHAWYRRHFLTKPDWQAKILYLNLGTIDDADEVFVNGHFIGFSGSFPPHYVTSYATERLYPLPQWCLNYSGDNVIAVRVYDHELSGGIVRGRIGIAEQVNPLEPAQSLAGNWKIAAGDDPAWKEAGYDDSHWLTVKVPAFWETQGLKGYDGYAWYRLRFRPSSDLDGNTLLLLLGKIDDLDETYLNGKRIGQTGSFRSTRERMSVGTEYRELRAYRIPPGLLKTGEENVIAVRVYDDFLHGGIYDGPIGITNREPYLRWKDRPKGSHRSTWEVIRDWLRELL